MTDPRRTLERELERLSPRRISLDELERRRDRKQRDQRIRAGVVGLALVIAVGLLGIIAIRSTRTPADDPAPPPVPSLPELRRRGEVIVFTPRGTGRDWDLAAQDPETGEVRTIVETRGITDCPDVERCASFVRTAEWSPDGRWLAFEVSSSSLDGPPLGPCGPTAGIWVTNALGDLRQLTTPCDDPPPGSETPIEERWAWSPTGDRLAYARVDGGTDELFVIDPSDGSQTSLGTADGHLSELEWAADGTRIAYADGGSVYAVEVEGRERSLLADSFSDAIDILWSPDGTRILVYDHDRNQLQVMNADGSGLHLLHEGEDAGGPTAWSPTGDRILYMLSVVRPGEPEFGLFDSEVWTVSPDGSNAIQVFDSDGCDMGDMGFVGDSLPVWAPDGMQVAYNDCGVWVVANADGTGEAQPLGGAPSGSGGPPLVHRSWDGGGLSQWDLAMIGQVDH
jgi:Tol biopolymer transport system component